MVFVPIKIKYSTKEQDIKETFIWDLPLDCISLSSHSGINPFTFSEIYCQINNLTLKLYLKKIAQQIYKQLAHYQNVIRTIQHRFSLKEVPQHLRAIELKKYSKLFTVQINIQRKEYVFQDQFHWEANLARLFPPHEIENILSNNKQEDQETNENSSSKFEIPNSGIISSDRIAKQDLDTIDFVDAMVAEMNIAPFFQPLILFDIIDQTWQQYELIATAQVPLTAAPSVFPEQSMEIETEISAEEKQNPQNQQYLSRNQQDEDSEMNDYNQPSSDMLTPTKKEVERDEGTIFRAITAREFLDPLALKKKGSMSLGGSGGSSSSFSVSPQKVSSSAIAAASQQLQSNPMLQQQMVQEYLSEWAPRLWKLNEEEMKLLQKKEGETRGRKRKIRAK